MAVEPRTGKWGSQSGWLLVDGFNLIANKLKGLRYKVEAQIERSDGIGDNWEEYCPTGLIRAELAQEGAFFDTDTNRIHTAMVTHLPSSPQYTTRITCCGFAGHTIGQPFVGFEGSFNTAYEVLATNGNLTKANAEYVISGRMDNGVILQGLETKDADWNTKTLGYQTDYTRNPSQRVIPISSHTAASPCVVTTSVPHGLTSGDIILISGVSSSGATINGERTATVISTTTFSVPVDTSSGTGTGGTFVRANSQNGGAGYLQVTATTMDAFVGTIRDSPDDVTYADLVTFTVVTSAPTAQRVEVSGTVDRYLCFNGDVTLSLSASASTSPSASVSPSASISPSASTSISPSSSLSPSVSASRSASASISPSASTSLSPSSSVSPSSSLSPSVSASRSASASLSPSVSASRSASASVSPSVSPSAAAAGTITVWAGFARY